MSQHTPGPWEYDRITRTNRFGIWRLGVRLATTERRPDTTVDYGDSGEEVANARLLAAAPEMYGLLIELAETGDEGPIAIAARALLARIEGDST